MPIKNHNSGQILLITLLVLSIAATIVLSLIGRSTTDVAISNEIAQSSQAFSAAEAGIEEALKTGVSSGVQTLAGGTTYQTNVYTIGGASGIYQYPGTVSVDDEATIWLINHNADGSLNFTPTYTQPSIDICWSSGATIPAIFVNVFYKNSGGSYNTASIAYDPNGARRSTDNFAAPGATTGGCGDGTTVYKATVTFAGFSPAINPAADTLIAIRIQPVYATAALAVNSAQILPLQGNRIDSTGTAGNGVTRKVVVFQEYREPSPIFDNVIYSLSNFAH